MENGTKVIEKSRVWKGKFIPLIPVIGHQVQLDGEKLIFNGWDKDKGVGKGKRWTRQDDAN